MPKASTLNMTPTTTIVASKVTDGSNKTPPHTNDREKIVSDIHKSKPIVDIINIEWVGDKNVLKLIKTLMDERLQSEMQHHYPIAGFDYKKAVFDIKSVRQVALIINIMVSFYEKLIPDDWDTVDESNKLSSIISNKGINFNNSLELISTVVTIIHESFGDEKDDNLFQKSMEDIIMSDITEDRPYLIDDIIVAPLVSKYIYTYIKVVVKYVVLLMHNGAKLVRHDVFNSALRMVLVKDISVWQNHTHIFNLAYTALYTALDNTIVTKSKK